jgi:hypothetical protein
MKSDKGCEHSLAALFSSLHPESGKILKNCNVLQMECLLYKRVSILGENMCWKDYFD